MIMQAKSAEADVWMEIEDAQDYLTKDYRFAFLRMIPAPVAALPATGDNFRLGLWLCLLCISAAVLAKVRRTA